MGKKSPVWKHFLHSKNETFAKCVLCNASVTSKGNTTNLFQHLKRHHHSAFIKLGKVSENTSTSAVVVLDDPSTEAVIEACVDENVDVLTPSTSEPSTIARRQTLLNTNMFVPSRAEKMRLDTAIAVFIASTCCPYSIVESDGFRHLMRVAAPNYVVPCRRTFSDRRIPALYNEMVDNVVRIVSRAPFVSLTTDAWTGGNRRHFLGVTCSFVTDDWELVSYALAIREADFSHTAGNIKLLLEEILRDFKIDKRKVVSVTTDRAANMKAATAELCVNHVPCFSHALNTAVRAMMKHNTVATIMKKIQQIHGLFAYSANANRLLTSIQREKNADVLKMPSACETRWWSELRQIKFVVSQNDVLVKFLDDYREGKHQELQLEHREMRLLKDLEPVLHKMEIFGERLSVETEVTASAILKCAKEIKLLMQSFVSSSADVDTIRFKHYLKSVVSEIVCNIYASATDNTSHIEMSTFMDPRFEKIDMSAMEAVIRLDALDVELRVTQQPDQCLTESGNLAGLFGDGDVDMGEESVALGIADEISRFTCEPRQHFNMNVLSWWKNRCALYPILSQVARKYLCISASSVASERVFSTSGRVLTKYRLSLTDEHSEQLVFLSKNRHQLPMW